MLKTLWGITVALFWHAVTLLFIGYLLINFTYGVLVLGLMIFGPFLIWLDIWQ